MGTASQAGAGGGCAHQPGGAYKVDTAADWYVIGGDAAALPFAVRGGLKIALVRVFADKWFDRYGELPD